MRAGSVTAVAIALLASVLASAAAQPTSPFAGEDYGVALLNLPAAWPASTGRGVTVAVVDSGVDPANPFLAPRLVAGHDFADGTGSTKDGLGHGTHVAGIVAQAAPDAHIMPVKVLDSAGHGGVSAIAAGVRWAVDHDAGVVNLSVDESGLLAQIQKEGSLNDAAEYAHAKGAVVISAAGNEHQHLQVYQSGVPVITVAAVDQNRHPASFTNWGGPAEVAWTSGPRLRSIRPRFFPTAPTEVASWMGRPWRRPSSAALLPCYGPKAPRRQPPKRPCSTQHSRWRE
jgi:subtilisin family serine protease